MSSSSSSSPVNHRLKKGRGKGKVLGFTSNSAAQINNKGSLSKNISNSKLILSVQQYLSETTLAQVNGSPAFASGAGLAILSPSLGLLDQGASFTALYDMYRIVRIDWEFRPMFPFWTFAAADLPPLIYTMLDFDDNVVLPSLAQARQYENMRIHQYEKFDVTCRPTCAYGLSNSGGTGSFAAPAVEIAPWQNINNTSAIHMGLKVAVTAGSSANLQKWWISCRLTIEFQTLR
jgi:hypothetical protein